MGEHGRAAGELEAPAKQIQLIRGLRVAGDEWFDAAHFPHATFVSSQITPGANGAYTVAGKLTIRGKTTDVTVPVQFHKDGANQVFDGTLPIKRLTYGIGTGEWKDTSVVADEVQIKFHIVTAAR